MIGLDQSRAKAALVKAKALRGHPAISRLSYFPFYFLDHKRQLPPEAYDQERFRLAKAQANVVRCAPYTPPKE
jgi:hypothetical protein